MMLRTLCGLLGTVACAAVAHAEQPTTIPGAVQLVRGAQNHLVVPVEINGHAATFLLDTGSDISFLQANRATDFGVRPLGTQVQSSGRTFTAGGIEDFRIGGKSLGRTQVGLFNPAQFRGPVPGKGGKAADGLLGLDVLRRYRAVINCRTQQLFIQGDPARRLNLPATTAALGFRRIEINQTSLGFLSVPCSIAGKAGALIIDTGAFVTVFNAGDVRALQLEGTPSKLTARTVAGRVRQLELARINNLRIGSIAIAPQRFAVMDLYAARKPVRVFTGINRLEYYDARAMKARRDIWGLLGAELLYQHHAIIDLDSMSLFLK
jgi:predicted aspartyl protease